MPSFEEYHERVAVVRYEDEANVIFDWYQGRPIWIRGFSLELSDFEIIEEAWNYYLELKDACQNA